MEMINFENKPVLENKIEGPKNSELTFYTESGGLIKSIKINGVELFYFDEERFNDPNKSDRGGAPVLFPMAGPKTNEGPFSELKRHGFARDLSWEIEKSEGGEFIEFLEANDETLKIYPYDFILRMKAKIGEEGDITLTQEVENREEEEMPVSMGLHPYFNVPEKYKKNHGIEEDKKNKGPEMDKKNITFSFKGGEEIQQKLAKWADMENDKDENYGAFMERIDNPGEEMNINIPGIGTIKMNISKEYEKVWIWTERGSNFICIEPVMRDNNKGEIIGGPVIVQGKDKLSASVIYSLEK